MAGFERDMIYRLVPSRKGISAFATGLSLSSRSLVVSCDYVRTTCGGFQNLAIVHVAVARQVAVIAE
jgi:hypothetical protein